MEKKVAKLLMDIQAVFLRPNDPFTWASGIKSPIYCDNRLTLSYPRVRDVIEQGLADIVKAKYPQAVIVLPEKDACDGACMMALDMVKGNS